MKINNLFFMEVPVKILLELRNDKNLRKSNLKKSREIGCTYMTYLKTVRKFEKEGLLTTEKRGRENIINLTKKGEKIADWLILTNKEIS